MEIILISIKDQGQQEVSAGPIDLSLLFEERQSVSLHALSPAAVEFPSRGATQCAARDPSTQATLAQETGPPAARTHVGTACIS